ncbi:MAG: hypothetical protein L0Y44_12230 [Phycisphaerales bacterium]|nr:hypothetical protein [Phycisphaerales bacterium]MCI0631408.1 hypothetical protein [Phycisphaerales bacterium]
MPEPFRDDPTALDGAGEEPFADRPWWEAFGDPILVDLINQSLKNNYDLRALGGGWGIDTANGTKSSSDSNPVDDAARRGTSFSIRKPYHANSQDRRRRCRKSEHSLNV